MATAQRSATLTHITLLLRHRRDETIGAIASFEVEIMWNGWKKAAIGLGALLTFIVLEFMAIAAGIAAFLSWSMHRRGRSKTA